MSFRIVDQRTGQAVLAPVGQRLIVGRDTPGSLAHVRCNDPHVSRRHCELEALRDGRLCVLDVSTYGTWINDQRVLRQGWARPGDRLRLGHTYQLFVEAAPPAFSPGAPGGDAGATVAADPRASSSGRVFGAQTRAQPSASGWGAVGQEVDLGPRYRVERKLGQGGMGAVYLAHDQKTNQRVAVKVLRVLDVGPVAEVVVRFRREAEVTKALSDHPGVVKVLDVGAIEEGKTLFYAMELVEGTSLDKLVEQKALPRPRGVWLVAQVARAVAWAHARGVIHRDLKPANVLVSNAGTVHLTDFGVAKALGYGTITTTGAVIGTPNFMAPEQIEDSSRVGPAVDVYGLGGMLHAVLTGEPPYPGKGIAKVIKAVQKGEYTPPRKLDPTVPAELDTLCQRALARLPTVRPASADVFANALESWLMSVASATRTVPPERV